MSARARAWARQHAGAGARSRVEGKRYQILMAIAHDADDAGVVDDATVAQLAARVHAVRRTVQYALRQLEHLGAIEVRPRVGRGHWIRVLQPAEGGAIRGATGGAKPQLAGVVEPNYRGAIVAPPHIEEARFTELPSTTTTVVPVPPGDGQVDAAGGGGSSQGEAPTRPRPVPPPSRGDPAGRGPLDPLGPVLQRLSPEARAVLEAIVVLCWDNPDANPLLALVAATAFERAERPGATPGQVSAAITRRATRTGRRAGRPRPQAAPASSSPGRLRMSAPHVGARPPGRGAGGRGRRDPHVRPAVPPPAPAPAVAAGPIPRQELERIALELAAHHGVPDDAAPKVAGEAAHATWLKAQQGNLGNVLLYVDGVVRRRAREAKAREERAAAAAAAAAARCRHGNDPANCGACPTPVGVAPPAEAMAAWRADYARSGGRAPPAEAS